MESKNNYRTPREMVGDEMLERMLIEDEPMRGDGMMRQNVYGARRRSGMGGMNGMNGMGAVPNCRGEYPAVTVANMGGGWDNPCLEGNPLAMVYSPCQVWDGLYEVEEALCRGTLFKGLDLEFYHACCSK